MARGGASYAALVSVGRETRTQGGTLLEFKGNKVALKAGDAIKTYHDSGAVEVTSRSDVKITGAQKITLEASGTSRTLKGGKAILSSGAVDIGNQPNTNQGHVV